MPPEEPHSLVAVRFDFEEGVLRCYGERATPAKDFVRVSWYTTPGSTPQDYQPLLGGVVFAYSPSLGALSQFPALKPTKRGNRYIWRDGAGAAGLMYVMVFPRDYTIDRPSPIPVEAKRFGDRLAMFWLLYPKGKRVPSSVSVNWSFVPLAQDLDIEVDTINRQIFLASKRDHATDYDIALSFAGEDRPYVQQVADELRRQGVRVFYDEFEQDKLWGTNLYDHLSEVYQKRARFTVMFISKPYGDKLWTNFERQAAQARAFAEGREYILPARFDNTELPGMLPTTAYISLKERPPASLAQLIVKKLESGAE